MEQPIRPTAPRGKGSEPSNPRGVVPLDLLYHGQPNVLVSYLLEGPEPALVDPGPHSAMAGLRSALHERGLELADVRHVLLTHVHLDHAGAAGQLARANPDLRVHVHADGLVHMADPARLVESTRRSFGEAHDRLWGEMLPVPEAQLVPLDPVQAPFAGGPRVIETPGHIGHHVSFLAEEAGVLLVGDTLGLILAPGAPIHPATPPPSVDLSAWFQTLDRLAALGDGFAALAHAGIHPGLSRRVEEMRGALRELASAVSEALSAGELNREGARFEEETRRTLALARGRPWVDSYFDVFPAQADWNGIAHYLKRNPHFRLPS
jgi:glyoxylase-like metal-dependent hydrolase (beta-lactamase superfamily II)